MQCRQSVTDLAAVTYGFGLFGFSRGASAGVWRYKRRRAASFGPYSRAVKLGIGWVQIYAGEKWFVLSTETTTYHNKLYINRVN